jgi:hypothetical protein
LLLGWVDPGAVPCGNEVQHSMGTHPIRAFSGKVESGFPSENATNAKMLERFLFPVSVKAL